MMDIGTQPGWIASQGLAINRFAEVTGYFYGADYVTHGFLYQSGKAQDLGPNFLPSALDDFADVVGTNSQLVGPEMSGTAALYADGVLQNLNTLIPAKTGFYLADAVAINNSGQIIGDGILTNSDFQEYVLTPICNRDKYPISASDLKKNQHWCLAAKGILITPFSAAFGDVAVGTTSSSITVNGTNTSGSPIVFQGADGLGRFNFTTDTCSLKDGRLGLEPGASCKFTVSFSPNKAGVDEGSILLGTSAGDVVFQLDGTGTD